MDNTPNYAEYSLEDLYDVEQRIDREKYPARYELVVAEIQKRQANQQALPSRSNVIDYDASRVTFRIIAALEVLIGVSKLPGAVSPFNVLGTPAAHLVPPFYIGLNLLMIVVVAASIIAGILLWLGRPVGLVASLITQAMQIPILNYRIAGQQSATEFGINFVPLVFLIALVITLKKSSRA